MSIQDLSRMQSLKKEGGRAGEKGIKKAAAYFCLSFYQIM